MSAHDRESDGEHQQAEPAVGGELDELARILQELGLTGREAKILLTLLRLGTATISDVARLVDVERANVYRVLEALGARHVAELLPGRQKVWTTPGRDEVINRLLWAHDERGRALHARGEEARQLLARIGTEEPEGEDLSHVHIVRDLTQVMLLYDRMVSEARSELLVFNQSPYGGSAIAVRTSVLDALGRGVQARALYEEHELDETEAEALRQTRTAYHAAGVEGRVVERLPIRLAIFDRKVTLFATNNPSAPQRTFPTNVVIEHPGFAEFAAAAFERIWAMARSYDRATVA